jgi:hypothetical protein
MMRSENINESGQVSILVLAISIAFLFGTYAIGLVAEVLIQQQRLSTKADEIALAGANELEFNIEQSCVSAQDFSSSNFGLDAECILEQGSIEIRVSEPNSNTLSGVVLPRISASSRAGIASAN